jgi:hypothetical protein
MTPMLIKRFSAGAVAAVAAVAACFGMLAVAAAVLDSHALSAAVESCSEGVVSRLYLGQATPAGAVTDAQWRAFVAASVTPRFPAGFTELQANGHWRDDRGTVIEEETRIVEIAHDHSPLARDRVRAVAVDYKRRFAQQSVLVTQFESVQCF